jgi:hypothetical protein
MILVCDVEDPMKGCLRWYLIRIFLDWLPIQIPNKVWQGSDAMHFSWLHCVAEHRAGTVKLRARWFFRPALTGEIWWGNLISAKGWIIHVFDFLCLTQTPGDQLNNEPPCPVRISLDPTTLTCRIGFARSRPKKRQGKNMFEVYRAWAGGTDHGDIPALGKCIEHGKTNPTF